LDVVTDSISVLDIRVLDAQIGNESARELGPLKYMSTLTGQPMETIVNWFMLLIIFVFDPLAIAMVVAANMAFANIKGVARDPKDYEVYKPSLYTDKNEKREQKTEGSGINNEGVVGSDENTEPPQKQEEIHSEIKTQEEIIKNLEKKLKHPRIQEAIKHTKRAGDF